MLGKHVCGEDTRDGVETSEGALTSDGTDVVGGANTSGGADVSDGANTSGGADVIGGADGSGGADRSGADRSGLGGAVKRLHIWDTMFSSTKPEISTVKAAKNQD